MQLFATEAERIGAYKGEILAHAVSRMVLEAGMAKTPPMPMNRGRVAKYRRWLPYGATTASPQHNNMNRPRAIPAEHLIQEGVNPDADTIEKVDVDVPMQQYGCLYSYSERVDTLYEDDIPEEMRINCGERMGLVREMLKWGVIKGAQSKMYAGNVTSRSLITAVMTRDTIRKAVRQLEANRADKITQIVQASMDEDTHPIEPAYIVYSHTDTAHDTRNLDDFIQMANYGNRKTAHKRELGAVEDFRFIQSPELHPYRGQGNTVANAPGKINNGTRADVYPYVVVARNSWADLMLRGRSALDMTELPPGQKDKKDPLGLTGYLGATFYSAPFVQNDGWMVVIESAATAL